MKESHYNSLQNYRLTLLPLFSTKPERKSKKLGRYVREYVTGFIRHMHLLRAGKKKIEEYDDDERYKKTVLPTFWNCRFHQVISQSLLLFLHQPSKHHHHLLFDFHETFTIISLSSKRWPVIIKSKNFSQFLAHSQESTCTSLRYWDHCNNVRRFE